MSAGREAGHRPLPSGTVTFLLTDVEGSTPGWDRDPDGMAVVMGRQEVILHGAIERHRGVRPVEQGEGDSVVAVFERAADAIGAALDAQLALTAEHWPEGLEVRVRMALHSGDARLRGERNYAGPVLNRCARLRALAAGGQVFVSTATHAIVVTELPAGVSLVEIGRPQLKGLERAEPVFQLRHERLPDIAARLSDVVPELARPALPVGLAAYEREPLIGRERELGVLRDAVAAGAGRRAVLVLGEPGIGKTRLAAAVASEAHEAGSIVALARCPPEVTVPFEPWVRAIGEIAGAGDDVWRRELARSGGSDLCALVPELNEHAIAADAAGSRAAPAEGGRYRVLRGIASALACAAGDAPVMVVLDDAHWCDPASTQALGYLLECPPPAGLLLLATARDRELGRAHPVSRLLGGLRRTRDLSELRLAGLDAGGLATLVAARVGRAITPGLASRLLARTAGNPFFAAELACELDERGALRDGAALDDAPVPDAVAGLVEERLARVAPTTAQLLVAIAAIGPSARVALGARAAGMEPAAAAAAIAEAVSERLVDELPAREPAVAFPHALIREALLAELHGAASARLHLAIAEALEQEAEPEPTEVARHRALAVSITGPQPAVSAHRHAASAAAVKHDHEQAAVQLRGALALVDAEDRASRSAILLELGDQELLAACLPRAREAFRAAGDSARAAGDVETLARAALGFAGGDIGFGWELPGDDPRAVVLLREAIAKLGVSVPRLGLQMTSRLCFALAYAEDDAELAALVAHADELNRRLATAEGAVLAGLARMTATFARCPERLGWLERSDGFLELVGAAESCGRDELLLRVLLWVAFAHYVHARVAECDATIARIEEVGQRLSSPRFTWEIDVAHAFRALDSGDRVRGEELARRGGAIVRRLRPDIQLCVEGLALVIAAWLYDGDITTFDATMNGLVAAYPEWGWLASVDTLAAALRGDRDVVRGRLATLLADDLEPLRRPDGHIPWGLCWLAVAAVIVGDRSAAARLRSLFEPLRGLLPMNFPALVLGHPPEWHIGRLELLLGNPDAAVVELRVAVSRAETLNLALLRAWTQVDLAVALHRRGGAGDRDEARAVLTEAEARAAQVGMKWVIAEAATARAELDGQPAPTPPRTPERSRPVRALAARTGRRALAALIRDQDDETLEQRFVQPRRQRALLRGMVRGFQPAYASGFQGVIAYEIEPFAIALPSDAPWRWAIEVDARTGRARLLEPAPLDAAVTIHFGLADWLRVAAGLTTPLTAMAAGRCSIEGDVLVAARLETMFGAV